MNFTESDRRERLEHVAQVQAQELVERLDKFVNGMSPIQADAFATALANEHPTLLGQIAKAVGVGVMRRATYEPWKPWDVYDRVCPESVATRTRFAEAKPRHADHDGRLDCETVIGAELMARQSFT